MTFTSRDSRFSTCDGILPSARMRPTGRVVLIFLMGALVLRATEGFGQQPQDSSAARFDSAKAAPATPPWRDSARYGGGPSVGAPPSDYTGAKPPAGEPTVVHYEVTESDAGPPAR